MSRLERLAQRAHDALSGDTDPRVTITGKVGKRGLFVHTPDSSLIDDTHKATFTIENEGMNTRVATTHDRARKLQELRDFLRPGTDITVSGRRRGHQGRKVDDPDSYYVDPRRVKVGSKDVKI